VVKRLLFLAVFMSSPAFSAEPPTSNIPNASCIPAVSSTLEVTLRPQKTRLWCWATSAQMVMEYLGKSVTQCEQANEQVPRGSRRDCCKDPTPKHCIFGGWPEFRKFGFTSQDTEKKKEKALPWATIQAQLAPRDPNNPCSFTPFLFSWRRFRGIGHMMVAVGYHTTPNGANFLLVHDPSPPNEGRSLVPMAYSSYVELKGNYYHWRDYYDVKPNTPKGSP